MTRLAKEHNPLLNFDDRRLTRAQVEEVCKELGPDHAWVVLGVSRSTLYKWRRDWRRADAKRARELERERVESHIEAEE